MASRRSAPACRAPGAVTSPRFPSVRSGACMLGSNSGSLFADAYGTPALIRRLVSEYALGQWKRYAIAFVLMAISAACTAISAYLIREFVNAAYLNRDFPAVVSLGFITV